MDGKKPGQNEEGDDLFFASLLHILIQGAEGIWEGEQTSPPQAALKEEAEAFPMEACGTGQVVGQWQPDKDRLPQAS